MINVNSLDKFFNKGKSNEIHVINNTTLSFPETGFVTFLGKSGSGKTTLLNVVGGLDRTKGTISYDGTDINGYKSSVIDKYRSENIGYVFQNYNLLKQETVYENLRLALEFIGINDKDEVEKRIKRSLTAVSMYKYRKRLSGALSGGQQQRISIARALVKDCKVIIADEPTGNLDSTNAIAVMNILKELSKTKLVLLVTHDKSYAQFYSDRILGIKDGSVIHDITNQSGKTTLDTKDDRVVYLGDLQEEKLKSTGLNITTFKSEDTVQKKLKLKVIYKNGVFYIDSKENLKIVKKATDIKIEEGIYKPYSAEEQSNFTYDTTDFNKVITKKRFSIKNFFGSIYQSFQRFRHVGILTKLLNVGLALIGIVIAIMFIVYSYGTNVDETSINYVNGYDSINITFNDSSSDDYYSYYDYFESNRDVIKSALTKDDNLVDAAGYMQSLSINLDINGSLANSSSNSIFGGNGNTAYTEVYLLRASTINSSQLVTGNIPKTNKEVVLSLRSLNSIQQSYGTRVDVTGDFLIGKEIELNNKNFIISGIAETYSNAVYMYDFDYYSYDFNFGNRYGYSGIADANAYLLLNRLFKQDIDYVIDYGRDINPDSTFVETVVSQGYLDYTGNTLYDVVASSPIVGVIDDSRIFTVIDKDYILKDNNPYNYLEDTDPFNFNPIIGQYTDNLDLYVGSEPLGNSEIVVSKYLGYQIGEVINLNFVSASLDTTTFTVTGLIDSYDTSIKYISSSNYITNVTASLATDSPNSLVKVKSIETANANLKEANISANLSESKSTLTEQLKSNKVDSNKGLIIASVVLLVIVVIYIYFIMRSKMLKQIYDIGVYRALGAKKGRIYRMFISDIFVTATLTTLLGYLLIVIGYNQGISGLSNVSASLSIYTVSTWYLLIGVLGLYVVNFVFGLLPIFFLMRKSPSEIIAKYDI